MSLEHISDFQSAYIDGSICGDYRNLPEYFMVSMFKFAEIERSRLLLKIVYLLSQHE